MTNEITVDSMKNAGKHHANLGKKLTPFDCRYIDAIIFEEAKKQQNQATYYAEMRGAFNDGWQKQYYIIN